MPTDASYTTGGSATSSRTTRIAGFAAGLVLTLGLGMLVSVAWSGHGLSSAPTPPEQIYFP